MFDSVRVCMCLGLIVGEIISVFASGCVYVFDRVFERETETVRERPSRNDYHFGQITHTITGY